MLLLHPPPLVVTVPTVVWFTGSWVPMCHLLGKVLQGIQTGVWCLPCLWSAYFRAEASGKHTDTRNHQCCGGSTSCLHNQPPHSSLPSRCPGWALSSLLLPWSPHAALHLRPYCFSSSWGEKKDALLLWSYFSHGYLCLPLSPTSRPPLNPPLCSWEC